MLPRILEPEVMDTAEEAADYDSMDHSGVNRVFVSDFLREVRRQTLDVSGEEVGDRRSDVGSEVSTVLDVGTGTALIPIELVRQVHELGDLRSSDVARSGDRPQQDCPSTLGPRPSTVRITAIDLAEEMLKLGRVNVERAGFADCITLELVDAKGLPYADGSFAAVMSNSIVHHIPEPRGTLAEMWRVLRPGGLLFVRDLLRPESSAEVERIVAMYAGNESPRQQQLFRQSLHAALTVDEVRDLLRELGIGVDLRSPHPGPPPGKPGEGCVRQTSDRHWTIVARR